MLPLQIGVGVPKATEFLSHAVQAWAQHAQADESVILVDFVNAYNTLDRQKMLEAVAKVAPRFLPFVPTSATALQHPCEGTTFRYGL